MPFSSAKFDDSALPQARVLGDSDLAEAKLIAAKQGPVTLRKTLLWHYSRIWPKPGPYLHIAQNCPQYMVFPNPGLPGWMLEDFRLNIAVPAGFELLGATGYYGGHVEWLRIFSLAEGGTTVFDGEMYSIWEITALRRTLTMVESWRQLMDVGLIHFMAYPNATDPPAVQETVRKLAQDDFWDVLEIKRVDEPGVHDELRAIAAKVCRRSYFFHYCMFAGFVTVPAGNRLAPAVNDFRYID